MRDGRHKLWLYFVATLAMYPVVALAADWPSAASGAFSVDTSIARIDSDADGLPDAWEIAHSLNPSLTDATLDPDGDGASNLIEYNRGTDPQIRDDRPGFAISLPFLFQLRPIVVDVDGDKMPDDWETAHGLNPATNDATSDLDGDGINNLQEFNGGWNPQVSDNPAFLVAYSGPFVLDSGGPQYPLTLDTDADGMPDWWEVRYGLTRLINDAGLDLDGDGLSNVTEYRIGLCPNVNDLQGDHYSLSHFFLFDTVGRPADTDDDGLPDFWENAHNLNPLVEDASGDPDGDGRSNREEYNAGTDPQADDWKGPRTAFSAGGTLDTGGIIGGYALDSDNDGMPDWWESIHGLNLQVNDASLDPDNDSRNNLQEYNAGTDPRVNDWKGPVSLQSAPFRLCTIVDIDGDGMHDAWEWHYFGGTDVALPDVDNDGDGQSNYHEFLAGTDPTDPSSVLVLGAQDPATIASNSFVITWSSVTNKLYILERSTNLSVGFTYVLEDNIPATPPLNTHTDTSVSVNTPNFYRIRIVTP